MKILVYMKDPVSYPSCTSSYKGWISQLASKTKWKTKLSAIFIDDQWHKICISTQKCSYSVRPRRPSTTSYHSGFTKKENIHKFACNISPTCWRCGKEVGTSSGTVPQYEHFGSKYIFGFGELWDLNFYSPLILTTWSQMHLWLCQHPKSLVRHLINAVKPLIPRNRKLDVEPHMKEWLHLVK